eukprot:11179940-Lingulodinium_polyedra.AAC.1
MSTEGTSGAKRGAQPGLGRGRGKGKAGARQQRASPAARGEARQSRGRPIPPGLLRAAGCVLTMY